jgi:hypothetical protein
MPVTWTVEPGRRFVVLVPIDPSSFDEWRTAMLEILEAPIARPHLAMLVDRCRNEPITTEFVAQMTDFFTAHATALAGSRTAVLVNDDAAFGMARMTEMRSALENPDSTIRVFRGYDEAVRWLISR